MCCAVDYARHTRIGILISYCMHLEIIGFAKAVQRRRALTQTGISSRPSFFPFTLGVLVFFLSIYAYHALLGHAYMPELISKAIF